MQGTTSIQIYRNGQAVQDAIASESPLTIRYDTGEDHLTNLVTLLRTPTDDQALCAGFLFSEGYLVHPTQLELLHYCESDDAMTVISNLSLNTEVANRSHLAHSGCGSCSLDTINQLYQNLKPVCAFEPSQTLIQKMNDTAAANQPIFKQTGGTHSALLFDEQGCLLSQDEDVGRHNALDKAIGKLWLNQQLEKATIAWVSGRIGFELVQKCINANVSTLIAVGAPTSLAVDLAKQFNLCVIGFNNGSTYNLYSPEYKPS